MPKFYTIRKYRIVFKMVLLSITAHASAADFSIYKPSYPEADDFSHACFILSPLQVAYIYGYNGSIVVAQVTNANKDQIAYSSFESTDKGYWTYSGTPAGSITDPGRTGIKYYNMSSGNISRTALPAGRYILSYWASADATVTGTNYTLVSQSSSTAINGWSYFEKVVNLSLANSSITISGSVKIDELRLYPANAQMTTFTYDLLIGKTSETDVNNATLYYEYDEFNRLKCVKDQSGNVRQSYIYHYKNQ